MRRKKLLAGVLAAALLVGSISPVGVMGAEVPEQLEMEQLMMFDETELQKEDEEAVTAGADVNGFVIEDGVLTKYTGDGGDVTIPDVVTSIGDHAFNECSSLTSITIPDSVTSIGSDIFYRCSNLTAINVSGGNKKYTSENGILYDKSGLIRCPEGKAGEVVIPDNVTSIEADAFMGCSKLISITIPDGVTYIGMRAFVGCSSLTSITIPNSVVNICEYAFSSCSDLMTINVSVGNENYISENGILYDVSKSTLIQYPMGKTEEVIIIPDDVTSIGDHAFAGGSSLTSITIPNSVTSIGWDAFGECSSLISITIPNSVTSIADEVFRGCSSLASITIPDSVTSIGEYAFWKCSSLTSITIPDSVTSIEDGAFRECSSLTSITIPNSVASIGASVFMECSSLTSITIPDSVTSIEDGAFWECSSLASITIPDSVTSIGNYVFYGCSRLISITIPDSVTSIADEAFGSYGYNGIIYCVENSYAETYAKENNIKYRYIGEKDIQIIIVADNITRTFGDSTFSISAATNGGGALSYISDNEAVAKIDSAGTITLTGAGTAHITTTASETDTYKAAEKVITITVAKKAQIITVSDITKTLGDAAFSLNAAVDGDGTLTYVSDNPFIAAITENGTVTLVGAGTAHITITAAETANYKAAERVITITVKPAETSSEIPSEMPSEEPENPSEESTETPDKEPEKSKQTITAKNITKTYGDKAFSLGAKTNGGGKLTYKVLNTKIVTINKSGKVTIKDCGRTQIKITAAANGKYQAATKTITLTVKPEKLTLTSVKSAKSKALTVKWKQDKKAKGYIIEYSTDKKFKKSVKTVTISKNSTVSKTVTKLKGGKTYYVRACAYTTAGGKKIKGNYSKVKSVKVKK